MVIAETLVGIQLVQSSCKAIKSALKTAEDVGEISGLLENMFKGREQLKEQSHPIASKWHNFIKGKTGSDKFLQMAIQETVDEKVCQEQMRQVMRLLNRRFGNDTWDHILIERDKKKKAYEKAKTRQKEKSEHFWKKSLEIIGGTIAVIAALVGIIFYINYTKK